MFSTLRTSAEDTINFFHRPLQIKWLTKGALLKEDRMAMTPDMDTARIERTNFLS